jgi:TetR/AcrR family transcriptional repressor of nem operon
MARPREFDERAALDAALHVFWTKGYAATSLDDLCRATGLSRSSLYGAFGGKRALYFTSLDRYAREGTAQIAQQLGGCPVRERFHDFVQRLIDDMVAGPGRRGCFIGNCAAELAHADRPAAERVKAGLKAIEQTFEAALRGAVERGELSPGTDIAGLARFLTTGIQGLRLLGKANPGRAALEDVARWMFRAAWPSADLSTGAHR